MKIALTMFLAFTSMASAQLQWQQNPSGAWWADTGDSPESLTYLMPTEAFPGDPLLEVAQVTRWEDYLGVSCTTYTHMGQLQGSLVVQRTTIQGSLEEKSIFYPDASNVFAKAAGSQDSEDAALHSCHGIQIEGLRSKQIDLLYIPLNAGKVGLASLPGLFMTLAPQPNLGSKATLSR